MPPITKREHQVLNLLSQDLTTRELAEMLFVSFQTVKSHRRSLLNKMGVKTTGGLVRKGFELGFLERNADFRVFE